MVDFREPVKVEISSLIGATVGFGHKSSLDLAGVAYNGFSFSTASLSYDTGAMSTAAHALIGINTILHELEKRGILIKG